MGYKELIEAIKDEGEKNIRELWAEVEAKAGEIRKEIESKAAALRIEYEERLNAEIEKKRGIILRDAEKEAALIGLRAQKELSERLFSTALSLLSDLRRENYSKVFVALSEEIPVSRWITVKVNPEDILLAESCFPGAKIISNPLITGGFEVENSDGNVIINTFEKRLERLWPEILPVILKTIREMYEASDK